MKINDRQIFFGAALTQIAEFPVFTSINKLTEKDGLYKINDYTNILIKYCSAENGPWRFTVRKEDLEEYCPSLVLICGYSTICLLSECDIDAILDRSAFYESNSSQWISVNSPEGGQMRVKGSKGELARLVPHNSYPKDLFTPMTAEKWPPFCKLNIYSGPPNLMCSTEDRMLDLTDAMVGPRAIPPEGIVTYLGLSTISCQWKNWTSQKIKMIEKIIKGDLAFDGLNVKLERISKIKDRYNNTKLCDEEFVWKLNISESDETDTQCLEPFV